MTGYTMRGDAVVVHRANGETFAATKESLEFAIANITRNRAHYKTEVAYQEHLSVYQGALDFLRSRQGVNDEMGR